MTDRFSVSPTATQRRYEGPLAPYVDAFAKRLHESGYSEFTGKFKLRLIAKFSRWLKRNNLLVGDVDDEVIARHLTYRRQRYNVTRTGDQTTLRDFLSMLREGGVVAATPPYVDMSPAACVVRDYGQYLVRERGLSQSTRNRSLTVIRRFLKQCFSSPDIHLEKLRPTDVTSYVLHNAHTGSSGCAKLMVGTLRSFFRFLRLRGDISIDLAGVVPSVAEWRYSTVPKFLDAKDVDLLLRSCDQSTATGRRDYAIMLLLARLGLRSGEVIGLTLDDLNWDAGELMVRGKGSRQDRMPIPHDVGEAVATYLRCDRPACATRCVFVQLRAPHRSFGKTAVACLVKRSLARANLHPPHKGAHLLRHSLATEMLRKGSSLAEIGEILRHRCPDTTAIYAKVDFKALRDLARPWPGEKR